MPDLEKLLNELVGLTEKAHEQYNAENEAEDEDWELNEDEDPWLSLEHTGADNTWRCGYVVRPDEANEWTIYADGKTPTMAAQELRKLIQ